MILLSRSTVIVGVVSLIAYFVALRFIKWHKLRHIPGPSLAAWSRLWLLRHVISGKLCKRVEEACERYGKQQIRSTLLIQTFGTDRFLPPW